MSNNIRRGLLLSAVFLVAATVSAGKYSGGTGDPNDPYQIASVTDLLTLAADANDYNKCFILTADINLLGQIFTTAVIAPYGGPAFTGKFDGNSHTIAHLTINGGGNFYLGLFGRINPGGEVKNLGIEDCNISSGSSSTIGSLAGYNMGSISNCYSTATVTGFGGLGGLVGETSGGSISYCYSNCTISGSATVGGFVGFNNNGGSINYCHSTGSVSGFENVGGLVGRNYSNGSISHCYSMAGVTGLSSSYAIGGLVGDSEYGKWNGYCITYCYSMGPVTGYSYVGGLVGQNRYGGVAHCYSASPVSGSLNSRYVAGLVGFDEGSSISKCYSNGLVSALGGSQNIAGLVANLTNGASVSGSFWDMNTSGRTTSAGGTGKTTAEMKTLSTFTSAGWDFVQTWNIEENQTYPFLRTYLAGDINHDGEVDFYDFAILASQWLQ